MSRRPLALDLAALLRDRLSLRFGNRLADVRVFGSHARGTAHEDSDVDVLVLIQQLTRQEKNDVLELAAEIGIEGGIAVSALVMQPGEFERLRAVEAMLALDIDREGVVP